MFLECPQTIAFLEEAVHHHSSGLLLQDLHKLCHPCESCIFQHLCGAKCSWKTWGPFSNCLGHVQNAAPSHHPIGERFSSRTMVTIQRPRLVAEHGFQDILKEALGIFHPGVWDHPVPGQVTKNSGVNWIIQSWPMTWCFKPPPNHQTSKIQLPTSENQTCPKPRGNKNQGHHQRSHASETLSVASWLPISRKYQISSDIPSSESLGFS